MHAARWTRRRRWFDRFAIARGRHSLHAVIGRHLTVRPQFSLGLA